MGKTYFILAGAVLGLAFTINSSRAQSGATVAAPPPSSAYAVVERGANHRVWQRETYEMSPSGQVVPHLHKYTELATGMHYKDANGQWAESKEEIDPYPAGAIARQGQYQVIFANNLNSAGAIDQQTPDGKRLRSNILGLMYVDTATGDSVMIAQLQDSEGQLISKNQVLYPNAFEGVNADVRYTYKKGSFEQDVILREQPPAPESFGLNPDTTELEVITEFLNPPSSSVINQPGENDAEQDENINWGDMRIGQGKAFDLDEKQSIRTPVNKQSVHKQYITVQGRHVLIEKVRLQDIQTKLINLPRQACIRRKSASDVAKNLVLPRTPQSQTREKPIKLASVAPSGKGYVLDYVEIISGQTNYIFQGDMTYYVSTPFNLYGTATIEGGTVVKFSNSGEIDLDQDGTIDCKTAAYRPAVFTSANDNTVGESLNVSSGSPQLGDVGVCLGIYPTNIVVHDLRFSYCLCGIYQVPSSGTMDIWNCQFAVVDFAAFGYTIVLHNVLIHAPVSGYPAIYAYGNVIGENITVDGWAFIHTSSSKTVSLTNCLLTCQQLFYGSPATLITNFTVWLPSPSNPVYQTVGAGSYYLTNGSPYHGYGTANINPALLSALRQKTTYPPIVYSNTTISVATTFSPQAQRDNVGNPDLGYHYDPLDYAFGGVDVYTNLTFTAGTAVGCFELDSADGSGYGIGLSNTVTAIFNGTVSSPCSLVRYSMVQEGGNGAWLNKGWLGGIVNDFYYDPANPARLLARFTRFAHFPNDPNHYRDGDSGQPLLVQATDCEFLGGNGGYNVYMRYTNCLFYRANIGIATADSAYTGETYRGIYRNCTFYGGGLWMLHWEGAPFWRIFVRDCSFDGVSIDLSPPWNSDTGNWDWTWLDADYNAYYNTTFIQEADLTAMPGTHNVSPSGGYNWQSSWLGDYYLPTNSPLINAGSTTADQVDRYHFTTQTNQVKETNSVVDIGCHYVSVDGSGNPIDSDGDGTPDYLEDANGNGLADAGETNWGLRIITQPINQVAVQGINSTFSITATGAPPLAYQWFFNSTALAGAANAMLTLTNVQTTNAGYYYAVITNVSGSVTSSVAYLTVLVPPFFITQPTNTTVVSGQSSSFTALAGGTTPLNYQWYSNSTVIVGATSPTLPFSNATTNIAANYFVVATNVAGSKTSSVVALTVLVPPSISILGATNQTVPQGTNVSFSASASGTAPLSYQWFFNSMALAGATNSALTLTNVQTTNTGNYVAVVTNVAGSATSSVVSLAVLIPPIFTLQPTNQIAVAGSNVAMSILASGTLPRYQWYSNTLAMAGATNVNLTFTNVSTNYSGNYFAVATNLVGSATSSVAVLSVYVLPAITQQPASQIVATGSNVTFNVTAIGTLLSYQWQTNGVSLVGATNANLALNAVQINNSGNYSVLVTNRVGSVTSSIAVLAVYVPPMFTLQPTNQIAVVGSNVTMNVLASGTLPRYQWYSNTLAMAGATNVSLTLTNVSTNYSGNYFAVATNLVGSATSSVVTLTVYALPAITQQPASQIVATGSNVTFNVTAIGTLLNYQWRTNGVNLIGATNAKLALNAVQTNKSGNYSVLVTNLVGSVTSSVAVLSVYVPPTITVQPTNQFAVAGSNVTVSVTAVGTQLAYQWYSNAVAMVGATNPSLLFTNADTNNSANYYVVVANAVGSVTSSVASLSVLDPLLDTDGDGLPDWYEILVSHTDPTKWDSNGNGISDGDEIGTGGIPWRLEQARQTSAVIYANLPNTTEGGACGQCTVYLPAPAPSGGATIQYRLGGSAVPGTDFTITPSSGSLTITSGSSSGTISICAINDTAYSGMDRYATITLTNSSSCPYDGTPAQVNVIDNDSPSVRVFALPPWVRRPSATFGTNAAGFYFVRDGDSTNALTVGLSTAGGTAVSGSDYAVLPTTINFVANVATNWLPLSIIANSTNTADKTLVLTINSAPGYQIDPTNGTATVTIAATASPVLPVVQVTATVPDATTNTPGQFTFTRSFATTNALRVYYHAWSATNTVVGSANGVDSPLYRALPDFVDIPASVTNMNVPLVVSNPITTTQPIIVTLSQGDYTIGANNMDTVYVDGAGPVSYVATMTRDGVFGSSDNRAAGVRITRYGSALSPLTMTWSVTNNPNSGFVVNSASMSGDVSSGSPHFAARQSVANVQVGIAWTPNGSTDYTRDQYASLTLQYGTTTLPVQLNYTADNRLFSFSSFGSPYLTVSKGATGYVAVLRSNPDGTTMSVNLTLSGSATSGTDYTLGSTVITFTGYQSSTNVSFQALNNSSVGWKTALVSIGTSGTQVSASGSDHAFVRIQDPQNTLSDTDMDGDGLPDGYELNNLASGFDPLVPNNPYVDADRDGLGLLEELILGTNPNVADAPPVYPSIDDSDYSPLIMRVGAVGKMLNQPGRNCAVCHAVIMRTGNFIRSSSKTDWTHNPTTTDYLIRFLRGTNYPVAVTCNPYYSSLLPISQTNTTTSPHYTAAYVAQILLGANSGPYPFIVDTNRLLGTNLPMVQEVLPKTATLYVPDLTIAADVDRSGVIDFKNRTDRTATNNPFVFWINDDSDSGSDDAAQDLDPSVSTNQINSANTTINGLRDLEDFARIQFKIDGLPSQFLTGGYQVKVYLTNLVGSPSIRLFPAADANGGLGYLTNTNVANQQVLVTAIGVVTNGTPLTIASSAWLNAGANSFFLPMIFEGISTGSCVVTFGFSTNNGPPVALSRPFYLNLKRATDLYEHWTVGDNTNTDWTQIPAHATRTGDSAVFDLPQKQADNDYILFVHGWRMQPWERRAFASTAYKRLWHLGYKGRFGMYSWPTDWVGDPLWQMLLDSQNYDRSEQRAWQAGKALGSLLEDWSRAPNAYRYRVRLLAHSMGNIVASEALRNVSMVPSQLPLIQSYIASQAASVAHAYDAVNPAWVIPSLKRTPEVYAAFPINGTTHPYFTGMKNAVQNNKIINFNNLVDYALNTTLAWPNNQFLKPDSGWYCLFPPKSAVYTYWRNDTNILSNRLYVGANNLDQTHEIYAHIAQAESKALGCAEDNNHHIQGEIGGAVNLNNPPFNYQDNTYEHSAEFNSINMNRRSYWWQVLSTFSLTNNLPQP